MHFGARTHAWCLDQHTDGHHLLARTSAENSSRLRHRSGLLMSGLMAHARRNMACAVTAHVPIFGSVPRASVGWRGVLRALRPVRCTLILPWPRSDADSRTIAREGMRMHACTACTLARRLHMPNRWAVSQPVSHAHSYLYLYYSLRKRGPAYPPTRRRAARSVGEVLTDPLAHTTSVLFCCGRRCAGLPDSSRTGAAACRAEPHWRAQGPRVLYRYFNASSRRAGTA
jgi:hypothetical protein